MENANLKNNEQQTAQALPGENEQEKLQALKLDELEQVSGGTSAWGNVPTVPENPYPVKP